MSDRQQTSDEWTAMVAAKPQPPATGLVKVWIADYSSHKTNPCDLDSPYPVRNYNRPAYLAADVEAELDRISGIMPHQHCASCNQMSNEVRALLAQLRGGGA